MATIRKRGDKFHVQVRQAGFPARTASFPTRRLAERWAKTKEAEMIEGRHFVNAAGMRRTVAEAIDKYILEELPKLDDQKLPATRLKWWRGRLGARKLYEVTPELLSDCKNELLKLPVVRAKPALKRSLFHATGVAPTYARSGATVDRYLGALSVVFSTAKREWRWTNVNPLESVSRFGDKKRTRYPRGAEAERLLAEIAKDAQFHCFTQLSRAATTRSGELVKLDWPDVEFVDDGDAPTARLFLGRTKNDEPRVAQVFGDAVELLRAHHGRAGKPETGRVFKSPTGKRYRYNALWDAAKAAAGVTDMRFHDWRRASATALARAGASEQQLKAIGGWKSNAVSIYVQLAAEDVKDVQKRMVRSMEKKKDE